MTTVAQKISEVVDLLTGEKAHLVINNPQDPKEVMDFIKTSFETWSVRRSENFKKELFEEVLGYWIEYNHSFSIPIKNGGRKEGKETFTWLDEDNTQMDMLYE